MNWLSMPRTPEPEVMAEADEVEAYASAAAQAYLDAIDNTLVEQVVSFAPTDHASGAAGDSSALSGWLLDAGSGPWASTARSTWSARRVTRRENRGAPTAPLFWSRTPGASPSRTAVSTSCSRTPYCIIFTIPCPC